LNHRSSSGIDERLTTAITPSSVGPPSFRSIFAARPASAISSSQCSKGRSPSVPDEWLTTIRPVGAIRASHSAQRTADLRKPGQVVPTVQPMPDQLDAGDVGRPQVPRHVLLRVELRVRGTGHGS
jgi:hypothetical protein